MEIEEEEQKGLKYHHRHHHIIRVTLMSFIQHLRRESEMQFAFVKCPFIKSLIIVVSIVISLRGQRRKFLQQPLTFLNKFFSHTQRLEFLLEHTPLSLFFYSNC